MQVVHRHRVNQGAQIISEESTIDVIITNIVEGLHNQRTANLEITRGKSKSYYPISTRHPVDVHGIRIGIVREDYRGKGREIVLKYEFPDNYSFRKISRNKA